jgi:hypothetical protein
MTNLEGLLDDLRLHRPRIVGVDGGLGAGKTSIAKTIAAELTSACVHLDSFLNAGRASFLPSLRYDQLRDAICASQATVVVEGVCLLDALQRVSLAPDYLVFVDGDSRFQDVPKSLLLMQEVADYMRSRSPRSKANWIISTEPSLMSPTSNSFDVDIAFIRSKTQVAITLVYGGLAQTICGAVMLALGVNQQGTATLKLLGAEISATGIGGIILATSVMWGYFAYLARPKYSRTTESTSTTKPDGTIETHEFMSSTQVAAMPPSAGSTAKR